MITTTYQCDRCGFKTPDPDNLWSIGVWYKHRAGHANGGSYAAHDSAKRADWCRKCMESLAMLPNIDLKKAGEEPLPPEKTTLEDIIREIVREEMSQ